MTDKDQCRQFVLQAEDPETGAPILEARVHTADIAALRLVIGADADDDPGLTCSYELSSDQVRAIAALFALPIAPDPRLQVLTPWHSLREAPYLIHTGFELPLMIEGRKPLAVFMEAYPCEWFDRHMGRFDPFVTEGRFVRRVVDQQWSEPRPSPTGSMLEGLRKVYVARSDHAWRIEAYVLLEQVAERCGWNDALERFQGSLLGYEDWQNDWWIKRSHANSTPSSL